ncbi:anhydro-N-acetylmuramic acid kinase [Psychroserpens sp. Hel_I_66]|uniref:anhydro-N-acetylmuramic acid kinase n=1 Tax=Psychroserpens sp. Hel_I_66 TaxID=1250004 RepID=UPI0006478777|nr:anhydro-N-acetylmuramic acid kinase [Psychroserpens sp. Hel_I_66]
MIKSNYDIVGVMSGTSLDGIDLAHITFEINASWNFKINHSETFSYNNYWKEKLANLVNFDLETLKKLDRDYTAYLAEVINGFLCKHQLNNIDSICSHGHTALHQPEQKMTYQIGNLQEIAKLTNNLVVCDFRAQDVKLNGQGAPLVPIGDRLLFPDYDYCINLGGFANISSEVKTERIAYDICPVNIVMNHYAQKLDYDYDRNGNIAKSGKIDQSTLNLLNELVFYSEKPPKSLGLEWVKSQIFPILERSKLSEENILRTFIEHCAIQIANAIRLEAKVLFTGGGTYNEFLLDRIKAQKKFNLIVPQNDIIEFKEALIFGLLGVLKLRGEVNCLASVTGADFDHSSGEIYYP